MTPSISRRAVVLGLLLSGAALAQPPSRPQPKTEPVPPDIALHDLRAAYAKTVAEEMTVRFRAPGGPERVDDLIIRLEGSPEGVRSMLLEMGPLRIHAAAGKLTAISTTVPGKYVERAYKEPLTPASLAALMPPVPLPQLGLAASAFRDPTPYTRNVAWTAAVIDETARPQTVTLTGAGPHSQLTLIAGADTGRFIRLTANLKAAGGREVPSTLDLSFKPTDPGDPVSWAIKTDGRERVASITELRAAARPEIPQSQLVPDLTFTKPDLANRWSLYYALASAAQVTPGQRDPAPAPPGAIILFRFPAVPERAAEHARDAKAGLAVLRSIIHGRALPGEQPGSTQPIRAVTASAVVIELSEYSQDRWREAARGWGMQARGRSPAVPLDLPADELMWAPSAATTIDRFAPGANAIVIIVAPDRTLRGVVRLDGRYADTTGIGAELRAALASKPH